MEEIRKWFGVGAIFSASVLAFASMAARAQDHDGDHHNQQYKHVLLISVDGMHEADLVNYVKTHPGSTFAKLVKHGVEYSDASTSRPSDSFPGLLAFATGGSPLSHGVFYDDTYDATLFPPGSNCTGTPGTEVSNFEALDWDLTKLDGGSPPPGATFDPRNPHINPANLALRKTANGCEQVWPHLYMKHHTNTIFEIIHEAGLRTAWSDKHPAYEILNGPSGLGLDELYAPEINSTSLQANGYPNAPATADWTADPIYTRTYDGFKVKVVLNWIHGLDQTGTKQVGVPAIFGMNFQAVSVGQKVTVGMEGATTTRGGYSDAAATPTVPLEQSLDFVDASLGQMYDALNAGHLLQSTLFIVGAKHGQSPIDVKQLHMLSGSKNAYATADVSDPATLLTNGGVAVAQETADDVSLLWLKNHGDRDQAVSILSADQASVNSTRIQTLYDGATLKSIWGDPAEGRVPDIIIQPIHGTIYSGSAAKLAEHGGLTTDDTNTLLVVSNPKLERKVVDSPVTNMQVAPTILKALGLDPHKLVAVQREGTQTLPGIETTGNDDHGGHSE
ncbi:type I phosphodiesterase/nucleotide pyrophosphatase [Paraburkholderia sp. BL23I1N1]|uniref:alkaline phosphatase family protein n=1 Tax=Paraburkholderia sp. BL23I1N1 TaxID=1938802 RepID=UPI000E749B0A|nr:alkaline phosphatase family protein [Paraburkholderia sp. BL23I1N1]RKE37516.1 type I phosphodiesterase/nucleotide pyrophosphatase [Paraburkholderia sp. BL23I1N1]